MTVKKQNTSAAEDKTDKICARCGRTMTWRARWAKDWSEVKYCSDACKKARGDKHAALTEAIVGLLQKRGRKASICPSEACRLVYGAPESWPADGMEQTRQAARLLAAAGVLEVLQKGKRVDPSRARGPIRLRQLEAPPPSIPSTKQKRDPLS